MHVLSSFFPVVSTILHAGTYRVTIEQNETAQRLNLTSTYNLEITPTGIALIAAHSGASIAEWQYKQIKSYGKTGGNFSLESGRTSETGIGNFIFDTSCGKEIFGIVHRNIKRLKAEKEAATSGVVTRRKKHGSGDTAAVAKKRLSGAKYSVADTRTNPRAKRSAPDPPPGAKGTYRRSAEMDGATKMDDPHTYDSLPVKSKADPSQTYTKVNRPKRRPDAEPGKLAYN